MKTIVKYRLVPEKELLSLLEAKSRLDALNSNGIYTDDEEDQEAKSDAKEDLDKFQRILIEKIQ